MGVMERRKRRAFTKEFKAETVRLVVDGKRTIGEVARDLDLTESALRLWVHQAEVDAGRGKPGELTTAEREELQQLRREVKTLRLEREILKKWRPSSRRRTGEVCLHPRGEGETSNDAAVQNAGRIPERFFFNDTATT